MKFFLDSCDIKEIEELFAYGVVDGVTTNPTLIAKEGRNLLDVLKDICSIIKTSVSAEVIATDYAGMLKEAENFIKIGTQITIKLPMTWEGIKACKVLSSNKVTTNLTLCFSPLQALIAAKAGATYVSPFIGRLEDIGKNGLSLISDIKQIFGNYNNRLLAEPISGRQVQGVCGMENRSVLKVHEDSSAETTTQLSAEVELCKRSNLKTSILAASIRSEAHVAEVAKLGADVVTLPASLLKRMIYHPLTEEGLKRFLKDWNESGLKI